MFISISSTLFFLLFHSFFKLISPLPSLSLPFLIPGFSYPSIQPVSWILFLLSETKKDLVFFAFLAILSLPVQTTLNAKAIAQSKVEILYEHFSNISSWVFYHCLKIMLYFIFSSFPSVILSYFPSESEQFCRPCTNLNWGKKKGCLDWVSLLEVTEEVIQTQ